MEKFETFNELILALLLWITTHTDYKEPKIFPKIQFIEQKALAEMACGRECEILALTPDNPKYTIFLADTLSPMDDICHRGILLHELIHILQEDQEIFVNYEDRTKKHLREMDDLRQSVQGAVYEQKDPLLIYKFESFDLFKTMLDKVNKEIISFLIKSNLPNQSNVQQEQVHKQQNLQTSRPELAAPNKVNTSNTVQKTQPIRVEQKVGRNEKVKITNGSETKELKWKKAKPLVDSGQWQRV